MTIVKEVNAVDIVGWVSPKGVTQRWDCLSGYGAIAPYPTYKNACPVFMQFSITLINV